MSLGDVSGLMRHEMYGPFEQLPIVCGHHRKWSPLDVGDGVVGAPLSDGEMAIIDLESLPVLARHTWSVLRARRVHNPDCSYAMSRSRRRIEYMHRLVMKAGPGFVVDHVNQDGLDNRLSNLRVTTQQQNSFNSRPRKNGSSAYKGVRIRDGKIVAEVKHNYRNIFIGEFGDEVSAARAYDKKAKELFGEFAYTNADAGLL